MGLPASSDEGSRVEHDYHNFALPLSQEVRYFCK